MKSVRQVVVFGAVVALMMAALGSRPSMAQPRPHVYLLRGLINIFSLGMDTLASKIEAHGIHTTVSNHLLWQSLADQAAAAYKAGTKGPIIVIGHSLGADAAMDMAEYLDRKGVPVALVVLFDATQSYTAPKNVGTMLNLTQHVRLRPGPGFHGSLLNVDVSSDMSINHFNIDKSDRLHAIALSHILAVVGVHHRIAAPAGHSHSGRNGVAKPVSDSGSAASHPNSSAAPPKPANGATDTTGSITPAAASATPH